MIKLGTYENEKAGLVNEGINNYRVLAEEESKQFGQSNDRKKRKGIWSHDLMQTNEQKEMKADVDPQQSIEAGKHANVDIELNSLHGLRHLNASEEELI